MALLTVQQRRRMAVISVHSNVPLERKKHPDISRDNRLGRSRGGFGDGSGLPLNIEQSPGQVHESQLEQRLLDGIGVQCQKGSMKRRGQTVLAAFSFEIQRG